MKKTLASLTFWVPVAALLMAGGLMFIGERLSTRPLIYAGLVLLGIAAVLSGARVIATRQASFLPGGPESAGPAAETYSGCAAQLWGLFFVLFGLFVIVAGVAGLTIPERASRQLEELLETPAGWGLLAAAAGVFLVIVGGARILAGAARSSRASIGMLHDLGYRLLGIALVGIGVCLLTVGGLLLVSPAAVLLTAEKWFELVGLN